MKRFVPFIILVFLLAIVSGLVFGFVRGKQKRNAEIMEFSLCETRFNEGQYESAAQLLETFLQDHPKSNKAANAYYYLATCWQNLGDSSRAMDAWSKIIKDYPKSLNRAEAYYYLGVGNQDLGQHDKAMENYKTVVNRFPNLPVAAGAWYGLGKAYEAKGEETATINAYQKVLEKHPNTEFAADAEKRLGDINLRRFLQENTVMYEVGQGDSLVRIGAKFRTTPELIMKLNNLSANMLQIGQALKVLKADLSILVDVPKRKLYLRSGDRTIKAYAVGTGKDETPTPAGDFKVTDKLPHPVWYSTMPSGAKSVIQPGDPRNELGSRWIGFIPAYGIHGTIDPESIGKAMSNGCVRMHNRDVEELYNLVVTGVPVIIVAEGEKTHEPASESRRQETDVNNLDRQHGLPSTIISMLDKSYPAWRFPDVSGGMIAYFRTKKPTYDPNLVRGDFNADGAKDYAVQITHGDPRKDRVVIAFLSQDADFGLYILESGLDSGFSPAEPCLCLYRKGEQDYDYDTDKYFHYPADSVGVRHSRVAGVSYVFKGDKFRRVATVD